MSQDDDSMLDEFLDGKSSLSKIYQQGTKQQPPADLDDKILAQAQQAVQENHSGERHARVVSQRPRWLVPASLAATLMLGINLAYQLKDPLPQAPYAENSSVVVDDRFEAKRQQAAQQKNQAAKDTGNSTQPVVQAMRNIETPPANDTRFADHDKMSEQFAESKALAKTSPHLRAELATPAPSSQPTVVSLERRSRSQIVASPVDNAMPESEADMSAEAELTQDNIAYAPAPATVAAHNNEGLSRLTEAQDHSSENFVAFRNVLPTSPKESTPSRSAGASPSVSTEEESEFQDAERFDHSIESAEDSLSSMAVRPAPPPSPGFSRPGQSTDLYLLRKDNTQSYLCDLTALGISDAQVDQITLESPRNQSRQSQSTWKDLIVVEAGRGDYRQACLELAAFHRRYPDATVREDFPVRLSD